ncbi:hypothetical protein OEZ85_009340 [Tetradesmus obliquus]|uniref:Peptidase S8/S53 domain-containing protein n=1 Tax=Tetradesmus obliquus TaxID=3088 RepID=A0ABY8U902_TETOB|nr:hypothetical protein OEZ85_009340 [Tetradesmus obliquus]
MGSCRHLYRHAFSGLSGRFNRQQFAALQQCAGPDGIHYMERDGAVAKAEKDDFRNWWLSRPPAGTSLEQLLAMQQQQQQQQQVKSFDGAPASHGKILAFMPAEGSAKAQSADQPQPLPQPQVEAANEQPGLKVQRLVNALWNLDRLDQRALPLDGSFSYGTATAAGTGKNVTIYMLDSGIKASHQEFQPWGAAGAAAGSSRAIAGPDFVDDDDDAADCDGHGTHVSSTAAGRSVGIAREATVMAVRVLDCDGAGSISNVVAALEWVANNARKPAVASLSLGVPSGQWSRSLEAAVKNVIAAGVPVVVAAGNSAVDACDVAPARVPGAITVGASNLPSKFQRTRGGDTENLYRWSNTGPCIDVFAPGVDIYGACGGPSRCEAVVDTAYTWASGTSMAAPHVTGMIAVYLETHPNASPADVADAIVSSSTPNLINSPLLLEGTPNRMLYSRGVMSEGADAPRVAATDGPQE